MGLIDLNVFEAFNLSTKRRTAVQVRIISVPGNKAIDTLQFIGRDITVTRTLLTTTGTIHGIYIINKLIVIVCFSVVQYIQIILNRCKC